MDYKIIELLPSQYTAILSRIQAGEQEIVFSKKDTDNITILKIINDKIPKTSDQDVSSETNIVINWMKLILGILNNTDYDDRIDMEDSLHRIESICETIKLSVSK